MKNRLTGQPGVNNFDPHKVIYLKGDINYSHVHLLNGEVVLSARTLKWFAQKWPLFLRVHKQALVNPLYIHQLKLAASLRSTSYVIMQDKARMAISRRRVHSIIEQFR